MRIATQAADFALSRADLEASLVIVRLAYEGLAQEEAWAEMLRQVQQLFIAQDTFLIRTAVSPESTSFVMAEGVDPAVETRWATRFAGPSRNPTVAAVLELGFEAGTFSTGEIVPWQQLERTEFFDLIRRPRGVRWVLSGGRAIAPDSRRYLAVNRHATSPRFGLREEALMDQLWPHIDRVLQLKDEATRREAEARLLSGALDTHQDALLFFRVDGGVRALNSRGVGLLTENGRLAREPRTLDEMREPLRAAFRQVLHFLSRLGDSARPPAPFPQDRLVRLSGSRALRIRCDLRFESGTSMGVLVLCQQTDSTPEQLEVNLDGWGLSPREQEVASRLVLGSASEEICRSLGISRETLKTHIRHICQKTETEGRTQLVSRLFRGREG